MQRCKKCGSENAVRNGWVGGRQRYRCKDCGCNFREGGARTDEKVAVKKALCLLLHTMTKASFRTMGKILGVDHSLVYRWIRAFGGNLPEPKVPGEIREMEFDEVCHFIGSKKGSVGSSGPWIVAHGEPWPGCSMIVMLEPFGGSTTKSET